MMLSNSSPTPQVQEVAWLVPANCETYTRMVAVPLW
jgi:hypothetical protein